VNTNTSAAATLTVDANTPPTLTQGFLQVQQWKNQGSDAGSSGMADFHTNIAGSGVVGTTPTLLYYVGGVTSPNQPRCGQLRR